MSAETKVAPVLTLAQLQKVHTLLQERQKVNGPEAKPATLWAHATGRPSKEYKRLSHPVQRQIQKEIATDPHVKVNRGKYSYAEPKYSWVPDEELERQLAMRLARDDRLARERVMRTRVKEELRKAGSVEPPSPWRGWSWGGATLILHDRYGEYARVNVSGVGEFKIHLELLAVVVSNYPAHDARGPVMAFEAACTGKLKPTP